MADVSQSTFPTSGVTCSKCQVPINLSPSHEVSEISCPACDAAISIHLFPRLTSGEDSTTQSNPGAFSADGDATCNFYPELKAEAVCDECGCLMSKKASVNWAGRDLCMPCLHTLREKKGAEEFLASQKLYDNMSLGLVTFLAPFTLITGPVALYFLLRYRKSSRGLVPRSSFRWWLALLLAIAFTGGWIFLFIMWIGLIVDGLS